MENKKNHPPKLKRSMTAGQMEMISLGGAIGVGLFMGSTSTIKWTFSIISVYVCGVNFIYCNAGTWRNALC